MPIAGVLQEAHWSKTSGLRCCITSAAVPDVKTGLSGIRPNQSSILPCEVWKRRAWWGWDRRRRRGRWHCCNEEAYQYSLRRDCATSWVAGPLDWTRILCRRSALCWGNAREMDEAIRQRLDPTTLAYPPRPAPWNDRCRIMHFLTLIGKTPFAMNW